jgi:hypothetical protein
MSTGDGSEESFNKLMFKVSPDQSRSSSNTNQKKFKPLARNPKTRQLSQLIAQCSKTTGSNRQAASPTGHPNLIDPTRVHMGSTRREAPSDPLVLRAWLHLPKISDLFLKDRLCPMLDASDPGERCARALSSNADACMRNTAMLWSCTAALSWHHTRDTLTDVQHCTILCCKQTGRGVGIDHTQFSLATNSTHGVACVSPRLGGEIDAVARPHSGVVALPLAAASFSGLVVQTASYTSNNGMTTNLYNNNQ